MSREWFTVETIDESTYVISEYMHWEEPHSYLLLGSEHALLIDTGLGIGDISSVVSGLTDRPVIVASTHVHWDHIGGHRHFSDIRCHAAEKSWLEGEFPLPVQMLRSMLPEDFDREGYEIYSGGASGLLCDGDVIDLGGREVQVLHTPGHSPGHLCFWEWDRGYLFSGDLVYKGLLYANYPSTDPKEYLDSLDRICKLPIKRILPGHRSLLVAPKLAEDMSSALRMLDKKGLLRHGSGEHNFGDWSIIM